MYRTGAETRNSAWLAGQNVDASGYVLHYHCFNQARKLSATDPVERGQEQKEPAKLLTSPPPQGKLKNHAQGFRCVQFSQATWWHITHRA